MPILTAIRYRLEYGAARLILKLIDRLSPAACRGLGDFLGDLVHFGHAARRRTAVDNILKAGVADTPAAARRIARASFRHFALMVIESIQAQKLLRPGTLNEVVDFRIPPATRRLMDDPAKGVLAACGHLGNWEVMAQAFGLIKPVVAVAQPPKNPLMKDLLARRSSHSRFRIIPKHDEDMMRLIQPLKEGCALAIMIDQYALKKPVVVDFLGRPACSQRSIALLHLVTRLPIVFASCRRTGPLRFTVTLSEPLSFKATGDKEADIRTIIGALNGRLEAAIRECPEQYMWSHRRWRAPK